MKKMTKNKKVVLGLCLALLVIGSIGITMALTHARTQEVYNEFKGAKVNIGIVEKNDTLETWKDGVQEYPLTEAGTYDKHVKIKDLYTDAYPTSDTFVRARIVAVLRQKDDAGRQQNMGGTARIKDLGIQDASYTYDGTDLAAAYIAGDSNDANGKWCKGEDGYWYYTRSLKSASEKNPDMTDELIQGVKIFGEVPEGTYVEIQVLADAVQARPDISDNIEKEKTPVYQVWNVYPPSLT